MKKQLFKNRLLIMTLVVIIFFGNGMHIFAQSVSELEKNIVNKTEELRKLEQDAERIKNELSKVGSEKSSLNRELSLIDGERSSLENNISQTRGKIGLLGSQIKRTENEITDRNKKLSQQSQFLSSLFRKINQSENYSLIEQLLNSKRVSDIFKFRDKYLALQRPVTRYTYLIKGEKETLAKNKNILADQQVILAEETEKLSDQKSLVVDQENKKKIVLNETKNRESVYKKNLNATLATIQKLDNEIRDFESKIQFALDSKSIPITGSGSFWWPLDNILVTQRFGKTVSSQRLYVSGSHSGVDFRASVGTPVYAVGNGLVKGIGDTDEACPKASFGKWIFIEHDNGLSTTLGHLSLIKVASGQRVKKGDLVGYSGNTGRSTAPHLHLTVYATKGINGEQGARVTNRPSAACAGKTYTMPLAPTSAYLDPLAYLPVLGAESFKHN